MKKIPQILMVVILSFSIVAPSVVSLWNDHYDIEISTDLGEEDTKKESKKELEEKDTFLEVFVTPELAIIEYSRLYNNAYQLDKYSFTADITVPPPQELI